MWINEARYAHFWTKPHRGENKQFSTLRCTKTGSTQPKLSAACFAVQSYLAAADFVVFSNYCLIGTRQSVSFLFDMIMHSFNCGDIFRRLPRSLQSSALDYKSGSERCFRRWYCHQRHTYSPGRQGPDWWSDSRREPRSRYAPSILPYQMHLS